MSVLEDMRKDKLLKPAGSHEEYSDHWRDDPKPTGWKNQPAIVSKNTAKTHRPKSPSPVVTVCNHADGCNEYAYKSGLCLFHWKEHHRERRRLSQAKRRAEQRAKAAPKPAKEPEKLCRICGKPGFEGTKQHLCHFHYNEYQRELRQKSERETDKLKEASMERKRKLLQERWNKKLAEYAENKE